MSVMLDSYGKGKAVRGKLSSPPFKRTIQFAAQSIRLRFSRCLITSLSIIGAIAFLAYNSLYLEDKPEAAQAKLQRRVIEQEAASSQDFFAGLEEFTAEKNVMEKRMFVIALSILVCFAGIMNAMLMSVKERFREIATLKCLGAVNAYIRRLFVIESAIQGGIGSLLGLFLGIGLFLAMEEQVLSLTWGFEVSLICIAVGVSMTMVASILPIRAALRMLPVEALREEE